jgi:TonB family protein
MIAKKARPLLLFSLAISCCAACAHAADVLSPVLTNSQVPSSQSETADGAMACASESLHGDAEHEPKSGDSKISGPELVNGQQPTFPDEARKYAHHFMKEQHAKRFETTSTVRLTVDTEGNPHNLCILHEAGHGFDRAALEAVSRYHFSPAKKDGKPVAVRLAIEVKFEIW